MSKLNTLDYCYIARYRAAYPDNDMSDEELIKTAEYSVFAFNSSVRNCAAEIMKSLKPHMDKMFPYYK